MTTPAGSLARLAEQIAAEREAARPFVAKLQESLDAYWDRIVPDDWRTLGMALETIDAADKLLEQNPTQSRELAHFALAITSSIRKDAYPAAIVAQTEAHAWRQAGTAHRYTSAYDAALRAYDAARRVLSPFHTFGHDEAMIELARAVVLSDMGRQDEALDTLMDVAPVFESYGDTQRVARTHLMKGNVYFRRTDFPHAQSAYEEARAVAAASQDLPTLAAAYGNLGQTFIETDNLGRAAGALQQARDLYIAMEMSGEITRTDHILARLLLRTGEFDRAQTMLQSVRKRYLSKAMVEEAGLAALDLVDALIATGKRDAAQAMTESVIGEFSAAALNTRAQTALAYLHELLRDHPAPAASIRHVRSYLEHLRTEPNRAFLPLPENQ